MSAPVFTFDEAAHVYRDINGLIVPSVTQCLKAVGLISFAGIDPHVLERKRQLGTLVHKVTELYDKGENLDDYEIPPSVQEYVDGYITFRSDTGFAPTIVESRSIAEVHGMWFGMQPDRVGELNGVPHIIELKCTAQSHPAHGVQLAGYATGLYGARPSINRASVVLGPQHRRGYKFYSFDDPADYRIWVSALALTSWQQNNRIFQIEDVPERLDAV
jgi:hypothetical protein